MGVVLLGCSLAAEISGGESVLQLAYARSLVLIQGPTWLET